MAGIVVGVIVFVALNCSDWSGISHHTNMVLQMPIQKILCEDEE